MVMRKALARYLEVAARYVRDPGSLRWRSLHFMPGMYDLLTRPWVQALGIGSVLDIGALFGAFAYTARHAMPEVPIYCFEPVQESYDRMWHQLIENSIENCRTFRQALGDRAGFLTMNQSAWPGCSSFLPMAPMHAQLAPESAASQPVTVRMERLDDVAHDLNLVGPLLIKMDVQGYEDKVVGGGMSTFRERTALVIVENSYDVLYEGQALFPDLYRLFMSMGFEYRGAIGQVYRPEGLILHEDSIFVRDENT